MSEMSEKARSDAKEKVKRLTSGGKDKVDASGWTEDEYGAGMMHTEKKLGNRPISKQNLACGGKAAHKHAGRKGRDMGGPMSAAGANYVANVPAPPQNRFSFTGQPSPFLGAAGMAKGGMTAGKQTQPKIVNPPPRKQMSDDDFYGKYGITPQEHLAQKKAPVVRKYGGKADGHWMEKAFANSHGQLHKELGVKSGEKIPAKKLEKAEHSKSGLERKRANLVKIAERSHKAAGGSAKMENFARNRAVEAAARAAAKDGTRYGPMTIKPPPQAYLDAARRVDAANPMKTPINRKDGGQAEEIIGNRPKGGRIPRADGGKASKKGTTVNIIIAQKPEHPPMAPPGMAPGAMPPRPMPMPVPGAPGGAPPGMGAPPPGAPPPMGGPNMPPPSMGRASGGKVYPKMDYAAGGGKGRLEKIRKYGL